MRVVSVCQRLLRWRTLSRCRKLLPASILGRATNQHLPTSLCLFVFFVANHLHDWRPIKNWTPPFDVAQSHCRQSLPNIDARGVALADARSNLPRGDAIDTLSVASWGGGRSLAASKHQRTNGCTPSPRVSLGRWSLNRSDRVIRAVLPSTLDA